MYMMMVDIETLSLRTNAYITAIGLVIFTQEKIVEKRQLILRHREPFNKHIDPNTVDWWFKQSDEAREAVSGGDREICSALHEMNNLYCQYSCSELWANGPQFDICVIENAMRNNAITPAWKYYELRDVRTARRGCTTRIKNNHIAVDDAENQALALIELWGGKNDSEEKQ